MKGGDNKTQNRLWQARKRRGFAQKHVAHLLNQRSVDQISRYENGSCLPRLKTALKLEIVLGAPVGTLFGGLHDQLRDEILERANNDSTLRSILVDHVAPAQCPFLELLAWPNPSPENIQKVRRHAIELHEKLAEYLAQSRRD